MISLIRKHQPVLMVMITVLVIISFVWFFNVNRMGSRGGGGPDVVASVYGRGLTQAEIDRIARQYYLAGELGLYDLLQSLSGAGQRPLDDFIQNSLVFTHEADALHIQPSQEEIIAEETHLPVFQTNGAFDPDKLAGFIQDKLAPKGFGEGEIDEMLSMDLKLKKVKQLLGSTVALAPAEVRFAYNIDNRKMDVSVIRLKLADFASQVQLTEDDLKKAFDQRKDTFKSDEKRRVGFVVFSLTDAEKKLEGKEKNEVMGKLANAASDFTEAMTEKGADFAKVAAKAGVKVQESQPFTETEPDKEFGDEPGIAKAAFQMTMADPNSDAIEGKDSFYVLHLEEIVPNRPLTFDEARTELTGELKNERARETMNLKAADIRAKITADMKAGKSFADAAKALGQNAETIPAFSLTDASADKTDLGPVAQVAVALSPGEVSEFSPTADGGMLVSLDKFEAPEEAAYAKDEPSLTREFLKGKQEIAFHDWLRLRRMAAKLRRVSQPQQ